MLNKIANTIKRDFPIIAAYTLFFLITLVVLLALRNCLDLGNSNKILYLLSSISQVLAAILALVFSITFIIAQQLSKYSERIYRRVFSNDVVIFMFLFLLNIVFSLLLLLFPHKNIPIIFCASLTFASIFSILVFFLVLKSRLDLNSLVEEISNDIQSRYKAGEEIEEEMTVLNDMLDMAYRNGNTNILKSCISKLLSFSILVDEILTPSNVTKDVVKHFNKIESLIVRDSSDGSTIVIDMLLDEYQKIVVSNSRITRDLLVRIFIRFMNRLNITGIEENHDKIIHAFLITNFAILTNARLGNLYDAERMVASQSELVASILMHNPDNILEKLLPFFEIYLGNLSDLCCYVLLLNKEEKEYIIKWLWIISPFFIAHLKNHPQLIEPEFDQIQSSIILVGTDSEPITFGLGLYLSIDSIKELRKSQDHLSRTYLKEELDKALIHALEYISSKYPDYLDYLLELRDSIYKKIP